MADLLRVAFDWLEAMRHDHAARAVTYHRGAASVELAATVGRTEYDVDTGHGIVERYESRDYLLRTADLVLAGQSTTPQAGDRIEEVIGGETVIYGVMAPANEPLWAYSDPGRLTMRIHTKQVDTK